MQEKENALYAGLENFIGTGLNAPKDDTGAKPYYDGTDTFTADEAMLRRARSIAAARNLFATDVSKLDDDAVSGLYQATAKALFDIEDADGTVAFGRKAGDPRTNVDMLRRFCKGEYSLIRDPEYDQWAQMDEQKKFEYAHERETMRNAVKSIADGQRGPGLDELTFLAAESAADGTMLYSGGENPNMEAMKDVSRRMDYGSMTPEEQAAYRADVIEDYEKKLSKRQTLATYLAVKEGLSDRASMLLAKAYNTGTVDVDAMEALSPTDRDRAYTALSIMRGDQKKGHLLFVPTDFTDDTDMNRVQLGLYGLQQSVISLFTEPAEMAGSAVTWLYGKSLLSGEERKRFLDKWDAQTRAALALEQGLPDAESAIGEGYQSLMENLHWFIPYGMIGKGGKLMRASAGVAENAAWYRKLAVTFTPWKFGANEKALVELNRAGKAVAEARHAKSLADLTLLDTISGAGKWTEGNVLLARQAATVEYYTKALRDAQAAVKAAKASGYKGLAMYAAGEAMAFSSFAGEYVANCDAAGVSREDSVPMAAAIGWINARIENIYVPGLESGLTKSEVKSLMFTSLLQAVRSDGMAGARKWLGNRVSYGVREGLKVGLEEGAIEEPLQQIVTEHGKAISATSQKLRENGQGELADQLNAYWDAIRATAANDLETYIDTAIDMIPSSVAFGVTTIGNQTRRQHVENAMRRHANRVKYAEAVRVAQERGEAAPARPTMFETSADGMLQFNEDGLDYDGGVADMVARAVQVQNAVREYWQGTSAKGDAHALARDPNGFMKAVTAARKAWNAGGTDVVQTIADAAGIDLATAEVMSDYFAAEQQAALGSPNVRNFIAHDLSAVDFSEDTLAKVLPGYVPGSLVQDEAQGLYSGKVTLPNGETKTIAYVYGDISQKLMDIAERQSKADSELGKSHDARVKSGTEGGKLWAEMDEADRLAYALRGANALSTGAGFFEISDADGKKTQINADDVIYLSNGEFGNVGYGPMATMGTVRHETWHAIWKFMSSELSDDDRQKLAKTLGIDVTADGWEVDLDEAMAYQFEQYASGNYVNHKVDGIVARFVDSATGKMIRQLSKIGFADEIKNPKTGRGYALADFYDAVIRGELGTGRLGYVQTEAPTAEAPKAEYRKSASNDIPVEVKPEEVEAVETAAAEAAAKSEPTAPAPVSTSQTPQTYQTATYSLDNPADASVPNARYYRVSAGDGVTLVGELVVSDASELKTSYKGNLSDPKLQNRGETDEGRALVEKIAGKPDPLQVGTVQPRANNGFVWATPSGDVFIGNTRSTGVTEAYARGNGAAIRSHMLEEAAKRGIAVPEGVKNPVVHFVLRKIESEGGKTDIYEVVRLTNESVNRGMNKSEQAKNDADVLVKNNIAPGIVLDDVGDVDTAKSADAIGAFRQLTNAQGMIDENTGLLTEEGQTRLKNAILASLLKDASPALLSKLISQSKHLDMDNERSSVMRTATELTHLAAAKPQYDLRDALAEALNYYVDWRDRDEKLRAEAGKDRRTWTERTKEGTRKRGLTWAHHMGQGDMFRTPSPEARVLGDLLAASRELRSFDKEDNESSAGKVRAQKLIDEYFADYIQNAHATNTETDDIFGTPPPTRLQLLDDKRGTRFSTVSHETQMADNPEYRAVYDSFHRSDGTALPGWLMTPNGLPTHLSPVQWVQVRTPSFKAWFGDWEKKAAVDSALDFALNGQPVAHLKGDEFKQSGNHDLVDRVAAYFEQLGGSVENAELGTVLIDREGVKSSLGHGIGRTKAAAFAAVPDVIRKGVIFDRQTNWKGRGVNSCVMCAPIEIGGEAYVCEAIVEQKTHGNERRFYLHEVNLQSLLSDTIKTPTGGASIGKPSRPVRSILTKLAAESQAVSHVVDENGEPLVVYHGGSVENKFDTEFSNAGVVGNGFYFTTSKASADAYGNGSSRAYFINLRNPSQSNSEEDGADGLMSYNGELVVAKEPTQIKSATDNTGAFSPVDPDIRFSMAAPVERRKDLVAVHNMKTSAIRSVADLGGFAMPSIAVIRDSHGHSEFGDVSVLFDAKTIDPKANRRNALYSHDAWTPSFPEIKNKIDEKGIATVNRRIVKSIPKDVEDAIGNQGYNLNYTDGIHDAFDHAADPAEAYADNVLMKAAYLVAKGEAVETVNVHKNYFAGKSGIVRLLDEASIADVASKYGDALVAASEGNGAEAFKTYEKLAPEIKKLIKSDSRVVNKKLEATGDEEAFGAYDVSNIADVLAEIKYDKEKGKYGSEIVDAWATEKAIRERVDKSDPEYRAWINAQYDHPILGKGVYNGKQLFTASGNRRGFDALHDPATLENVVKAMAKTQLKNGAGMMGRNPFGVAVKSFKTLKGMIDSESTLKPLTHEQESAIKTEFSGRLTHLIVEYMQTDKHPDENKFIEHDRALELMFDAWEGARGDIAAMTKALNNWGFSADEALVREIKDLFDEISLMPTNYFEAKPQRAVGFDETKAWIVPDTISAEDMKLLADRGQTVYQYKSGDEADRLAKVNKAVDETGIRFSIVRTTRLAPNGQRSNLTDGQYDQVRTPDFKAWFGDWEKRAKLAAIDALAPITISERKVGVSAEEAYKALADGVNETDGRRVKFVNSTFGKIIRHTGFDTSRIVHQLKEIFDKSVPVASESEKEIVRPDGTVHKRHPNFVGYHTYVGKITDGSATYYVRLTVQEERTRKSGYNPNAVHSTFVSDVAIYNSGKALSRSTTTVGESELSRIDSILSNILTDFNRASSECSQVVDENGEPLVVYRGASFDPISQPNGKGVIKSESYFSPSEEYAKRYGNTRAYYLNIKRPFDVRNPKDATVLKSMLPDSYNFATGKSGALDWAEMSSFDTENIKAMGYDAIILDEGGDPLTDGGVSHRGVSYVPLDGGSQVKSATVNTGTFSLENPDVRFSVASPELQKKLDGEKTITVYRSMQVGPDGKLYPPMAAIVDGKRVTPIEFGKWFVADEPTDIDAMIAKKQMRWKNGTLQFFLEKGDASGNDIWAAYNPYWHTSNSMLNDQFSIAYKRNLVTVECEVPVSEDKGAYQATNAKNATGWTGWHSGQVATWLEAAKPDRARNVFLSRYCKVKRIVPNAEVADAIADDLKGTDIQIPSNVIPTALRAELEKRGVRIFETVDASGKFDTSAFTAMKNAAVKRLTDSTRFSIVQLPSGQPCVVIDRQEEIAKINLKDPHSLYEYLMAHVGDELDAQFFIGKDLPGEYVYSQTSRGYNARTAKAKAKLATSLDEAVKASGKVMVEPAKHKRREGGVYYKAPFAFAVRAGFGNDFAGYTANILFYTENGDKLLYDVVEIEDAPDIGADVTKISPTRTTITGASREMPVVPGATGNSIPNSAPTGQRVRASTAPQTIASAYPRLDKLSDEQLIAAAVASKMVFGKHGKSKNRFVNVTEVQRYIKALHPGLEGVEVSRLTKEVTRAVKEIGGRMKEDLARGVSESQVLQHLPDRMRDVFEGEMSSHAIKGANIGVYQQRAVHRLEEKAAKIVEDAVAVQSGVETALLENAYGIDFAQTLMALDENPYLQKDGNGNFLPASGTGSGFGEDDASNPTTAKDEREASQAIKNAVDEIVAKSAKQLEDEGDEKGSRQTNDKQGNSESGEGGDIGDLGEGDIAAIATKRAGVDLKNPRQLALFITELARRWWVEKNGLAINADAFRDRVALQFLRKTAANIYTKLVNEITYSQSRDSATRAINGFANAPTLRGLQSEMTYVGQLVNARKIRETQQQMCERLDTMLREQFGADGRFKPDREELRRKVSAELELRARYTRHAMWLTPNAAGEEAQRLRDELDQVAANFETEDHDADNSRVFTENLRKLNILREFGALRYKPLAEIERALLYWENALDGSTDEIVRANYEREVRTKKAAELFARAFHNPNRKTVREPGKLAAFSDYIQGHMSFTHLLRDMMRFASEEDAADAEKIVQWLELEIQKAGTRSTSEQRKHGNAIADAVKRIYGRDFQKVINEFSATDDRFAPFMGKKDGISITPTKGRAIQLMVSLLQEGHQVEVQDPDDPKKTVMQWVGGYHDNIVKFHREGQARQIAALLTPADLNLVKWIGQWYEANRQELSDVCQDLFGMGVYAETWNYFPVKMLLDKQGLEKGDAVGWTIFPRALTPRVKNERDFDTEADFLQMFMSRMEEAAQWKAHAKLGLEMRGIFGRSELQNAVIASHGKKANALMLGFITDTLSGHGAYDRSTGGVEYYSDKIRGWAALCALGGNVGVMFKQTTSIPAFGFEIGMVNTAKYMMTAFTPDGMAAMKKIFDSEERKNRWQVGNSEAVKNALATNQASTLKKLVQKSMITNNLGDCVPGLVIGQGIYRDALKRGMSEEDAMAYTWMLIERTQQSSRMENQSSFMRRAKLGRILYQFLSTNQQMLNYETRAIRKVLANPSLLNADGRKRWMELGRAMTLNHFILSSAYFWMGQLYKRWLGQEPPEDELKDWTISCLLGSYGALFCAGFTCTDALNDWIKGRKYGSGSSVPALSWAGNILVRDPTRLVSAIFDEEKTFEDVRDEALHYASDANALFRDLYKIYRWRIAEEPQ